MAKSRRRMKKASAQSTLLDGDYDSTDPQDRCAMETQVAADYTSRLPPEVLAEIFTFCPREDSTFEPCSTIWALGQVCSRWRQVSVDTPVIWTSICMDMEALLEEPYIPATSVLSTILERTRDRLLDIRLIFHPEFGEAQHLFDLLCDESERWATFRVRLPGDSHTSFSASAVAKLSLRPKSPSSFSALREADVNRFSDLPGGLELLGAFIQSPSLRKLVLVDVEYVEGFFAQIPWSQLTHFEVNDAERFNGWPGWTGYPEDFTMEVLAKAPNLGRLGTWKYSWTRNLSLEPRSHAANSRLSNIVELDLYGWKPGPGRPDDMDVASLHLPSLQHLTLRQLGDPANDMDTIMEMVERSSCQLLSVSLFGATFLDVMVKRFLSIFKGSLQKVVLQGRIIGPTLLECFFSHSSQTLDTFFPHLKELDINQLMLADLELYDRVLGLEIPSSMSRFHRRICIHATSTKNSTAFLTKPVPKEIELLQELGKVLATGQSRLDRGAVDTVVENMPIVDYVLTYLEKHHRSYKSILRSSTTKLRTLRRCLRAIDDTVWMSLPGQEEFRLAERAGLLRWD
ncbi:hypothetical protein AAF712_015377 [Marasmius tenuissimus]|uniref:F-box domain-containing protein n=1 Tax=Marasmius tenuissimus TaxID=585030 RepID=A0ABR2Z9H5_9AGAR